MNRAGLLLISLLSFTLAVCAPMRGGQGTGSDGILYRGGVTHLEQGWDRDTWQRWYSVSQGTVFMPYAWFLALEQPVGEELFTSPGHMRQLGFLVEPADPKHNPAGLPVGFSREPLNIAREPYSCAPGDWVGFGCAACHTGEVSYRGRRIRIEGGAAHHDIEEFGRRLGAALVATAGSQQRFTRFARRVIAQGAAGDPASLQQSYRCFMSNLAAKNSYLEAAQARASEEPTASGLGRLDAHERGVNLFLGAPLGELRNYEPETAPVSFPAIWDTPYFDWVLYNAAIRQPLARNIIEALGVQAPIDLSTILTDRVVHQVQVDNIVWGQRAVMDLTSPAWPEAILGPIDKAKAGAGAAIYQAECVRCHGLIDRGRHAPAGAKARSELPIPTFALADIGTDPRQAETFARRKVTLEKIGGPAEIASYDAGQLVTEKIGQQWIAESAENARRAAEINQGRPNQFRALLVYRARPLNGIWATAPYLHNGSVPNLDQLLRPAAERDRIFYMGNWELDPDKVGYETSSPFPGATRYDTRLPGNSNAGHEYGTGLSEPERRALIEYLKTL